MRFSFHCDRVNCFELLTWKQNSLLSMNPTRPDRRGQNPSGHMPCRGFERYWSPGTDLYLAVMKGEGQQIPFQKQVLGMASGVGQIMLSCRHNKKNWKIIRYYAMFLRKRNPTPQYSHRRIPNWKPFRLLTQNQTRIRKDIGLAMLLINIFPLVSMKSKRSIWLRTKTQENHWDSLS